VAGIPDQFLVHECTIEPYLGTTGEGVEIFAPAITVQPCLIDTGTKVLTRGNSNQGTGDERSASASIYAQLDLDTSAMTVRSRVRWDLGNGQQEARVDTITRMDGGSLPVPSHVLIRAS